MTFKGQDLIRNKIEIDNKTTEQVNSFSSAGDLIPMITKWTFITN
jgi:hypothetical protein